MKRNSDHTVRIETDPLGHCLCGPPTSTAVPLPKEDGRGFTLQGVTTWPPTRPASDHCQQYQRDPAKPVLTVVPDPKPDVA